LRRGLVDNLIDLDLGRRKFDPPSTTPSIDHDDVRRTRWRVVGPITGEHQHEHLVDPIDPKFKGSRADDQTSRYERTCPKSLVHPTLATFRPVLVGWSMGAMVAWEYVKRYGCDSVAGLVVVDQPPSDFSWEGYEFGLMTVEGLAENVKGIQTDQRAVAETFADLMQHVPLPELPAGPYLPVSCCVRT
jgi:hypothetical protein